MGGEDDPVGIGRLRLLVAPIEWILFTPGDCSQPSSAPDVRGKLRDEFAATGPVRGPLEAFPFIIGLGVTTLLSSRIFNLDNCDGVAHQKLKLRTNYNVKQKKL